MSKNAPRHIDEIEDPTEAVVAAAEWVLADEFIATKLEKLAQSRVLRGDTEA